MMVGHFTAEHRYGRSGELKMYMKQNRLLHGKTLRWNSFLKSPVIHWLLFLLYYTVKFFIYILTSVKKDCF